MRRVVVVMVFFWSLSSYSVGSYGYSVGFWRFFDLGGFGYDFRNSWGFVGGNLRGSGGGWRFGDIFWSGCGIGGGSGIGSVGWDKGGGGCLS